MGHEAADPWYTIEQNLKNLPKKPDPILSSAQEIDPYLDPVSDGIKISLPMDYYEREQERIYDKFWKGASELQQEVYAQLKTSSAEFNNSEATYLLAQIHLIGEYGYPHNKTLAYYYLNRFNEMTNFTNATVLFELAVMHSTGLFGTIPIDSSKALIYYHLASGLGDVRAKMALAYRYQNGVNAPRDCDKALFLYSEIAQKLRSSYSDQEWDIVSPFLESYDVRICDFTGGLLSKGLSSTRLSTVRKRALRPDITSSVLTNLQGGRIILQFGGGGGSGFVGGDDEEEENGLMNIYYTALDNYQGTYTQRRNMTVAMQLLNMTYAQFDNDIRYMADLDRFFYGKCLGLLGHMYFRGEGVEMPNITLAEQLLERAIEITEVSDNFRSAAHADLGLINQYIYGNLTEAIKHYNRMVDLASSDGTAEFQLSKIYAGVNGHSGEERLAVEDPLFLMRRAAHKGFTPAIYELASMAEKGITGRVTCEELTSIYKTFIEENDEIVAPSLKEGFIALLRQETEVALWEYAKAAEQGYEVAQTNVAYLLYQPPLQLQEPPIIPEARRNMALAYYTRSFMQSNADAGVIAGDIYYEIGEYSRAVALYQTAAMKISVQAMWNLGYMYEHGLGVEQDFHLAKRHYEQVLEHNHKLYFGVRLTILKLKAKSWFIWLTGGKVNYWKTSTDPHHVASASSSWFSRLLKTFREAGRENSGHPENESIRPDQNSSGSILDTLQSWGVHAEDLITIGFVLLFFIMSFALRTVALRRGWAVRVNGVPLQPQQQGQQGGVDIQFFAI